MLMLAFSGAVFAAPTALTLTDSKKVDGNNPNATDYTVNNGVAELTGGNIRLTWTESDTLLSSWQLSFDLEDAALADASIFGTSTQGKGGAQGCVLKTTAAGALTLSFGDNSISTSNNVIIAGENTAVTLSFVANETLSGELVGGTFTLSVGLETKTLGVTFDSSVVDADSVANYRTGLINGQQSFTFIENNASTSANFASLLWTNSGGEKFHNIKVSKLDNKVIPEPATATLSLLALAGLAARRRRR